MRVTICYALPEVQEVLELEVPAGASIAAVIAQSGLVERHGIDLNSQRVGIHARLKALTEPVAEGDRIEIYRPLLVDAKTARRRRAAKAAAAQRGGG